jgi:GNAT superfamily N-acetyltransferase
MLLVARRISSTDSLMDAFRVRRLSPNWYADEASWAAIRELCCRTGDNGNPIAGERWVFFATMWIEPYRKLLPDWSYVAESAGAATGYLTGCPDSVNFSRRKWLLCTIPLLAQIAVGRYGRERLVKLFVQQSLGIQRSIERSFTSSVRREIRRAYPAHLHVNVEADFRGTGIGRRLIEEYLKDLKSAGVRGVHLLCGSDPLGFYRHLGFRELERIHYHGIAIYALGYHLRS